MASGWTAPASAHGFGQRYDLPIPLGLWMTGAAAAVVLTFVFVAIFMRWSPSVERHPRVDLLRWPAFRRLARVPLGAPVQMLCVGLLALTLVAGFFGDQTPTRNLAPTLIWIDWWVGVAYLSALVGNVWSIVNPWSTVFAGYERLQRAWPHRLPAPGRLRWPQRLAAWPAVILFMTFAWIELVFEGRAIPLQLVLLATVYTVIVWCGMFAFGRTVWLRHGDPFAIAFGVFARFAPLEGWRLRPVGAGLLRTEDVTPSLVVFVLVMLSTVTFDGFTATPVWGRIENALYDALPAFGNARLSVIDTLGLVSFPLLFVLAYRGFARITAACAGGALAASEVSRVFVLSLVPIAIAYHLAHYFTYLLIQGQLTIRLASDPLGMGWNLFGTARYRPDIDLVGARFAWLTAVAAIVIGHVVAVCVAHMVALRVFANRTAALRSQLPMLVLMVGYTLVSLWIIAQPIVETNPGAYLPDSKEKPA